METGRVISNTTVALKGDDGIWTVTMELQEARSVDNSPWEKRTITSMVLESDVDKAFALCANMLLSKFKDANQDLFTLKREECDAELPNPAKGN